MMTFLGMIEEKTNNLLQQERSSAVHLLPPRSFLGQISKAFAHAKDREKARAHAATAVLAGSGEHGEDDLHAGKALVGGGSGSGGGAVATVLGHGPQTPMRQELIHVNPPKLEDFSSSEESGSDDDDARPLTRDELKGRTLNKIQRKN
ncbi:unnamed protein product, partial [Hapterophycus canaliculatus]